MVESPYGDGRRGGLLRFRRCASSVPSEMVAIRFAGERLYATEAVWLNANGRHIVTVDAVRATVTVHDGGVAERWGLATGVPFAFAAYLPRGKPDPSSTR